ncbi:MAG: AraC family transcriptional regulator [Gemmatimonadetes bacterium]|nr:MAG: AraC family transcriptional regulator [Gemmatimonadota bacterium]
MQHVARVLASPLPGVYSTHIDSAQQFGRHWHDTYGFGFLEHGAQEWFSSRGIVRGYPGDVISTNPGEVHDGRPLGPPTRRWRIVYVDPGVMMSLTSSEQGRAEITNPVIADPLLARMLQGLFSRLERWNGHAPHARQVDSLAFEEALVASCVRLMARHGARRWSDAPSSDVRQVRERLADDSARVPNLAELARLTGLSRYQVLRRFERAYGLPPHAWLLRRRAERARVLIRDGCTLSAAAAATGFSDQSHMTRVFARQFGFTPGAWRRAARLQ